MTDPLAAITPEFQRGWDAALLAGLEREAEVHQRSAELIVTLSPDDV